MSTRANKKNAMGRPKPLAPKASITRDGKRRYSCGGKIKK